MACFDGQSKTAETLVQKSADFSIGLNCRDTHGGTAFHFACISVETNIVEMMIELNLTAKDNFGRTGFQFTKEYCKTDIVKLIKRKKPSITAGTEINTK